MMYAAHIADAPEMYTSPSGSVSISTPPSTITPATARSSAAVFRRVRVNAAATAIGPMNSITTLLPRSMRSIAR